ncbi:hypothetical protein STAL104432_26800 [Streptomyces albus]
MNPAAPGHPPRTPAGRRGPPPPAQASHVRGRSAHHRHGHGSGAAQGQHRRTHLQHGGDGPGRPALLPGPDDAPLRVRDHLRGRRVERRHGRPAGGGDSPAGRTADGTRPAHRTLRLARPPAQHRHGRGTRQVHPLRGRRRLAGARSAGAHLRAGPRNRRRHRHRPDGRTRQAGAAGPVREAHDLLRPAHRHHAAGVHDGAQALPARLPASAPAAFPGGQGPPGGPHVHPPRVPAHRPGGHGARLHLLPLGAAPRRQAQHQLLRDRTGLLRRQHPQGAGHPRRTRDPRTGRPPPPPAGRTVVRQEGPRPHLRQAAARPARRTPGRMGPGGRRPRRRDAREGGRRAAHPAAHRGRPRPARRPRPAGGAGRVRGGDRPPSTCRVRPVAGRPAPRALRDLAGAGARQGPRRGTAGLLPRRPATPDAAPAARRRRRAPRRRDGRLRQGRATQQRTRAVAAPGGRHRPQPARDLARRRGTGRRRRRRRRGRRPGPRRGRRGG